MLIDKFSLDDYWDVKEVLVVQDSVNIFLIVLAKLLISFELPGLLVFLLEFLQP